MLEDLIKYFIWFNRAGVPKATHNEKKFSFSFYVFVCGMILSNKLLRETSNPFGGSYWKSIVVVISNNTHCVVYRIGDVF